MTVTRSRATSVLIQLLVFLGAALSVLPAGAGKPQPAPRPVRYRIKWLDELSYTNSELKAINNFGDAVGLLWGGGAFAYWKGTVYRLDEIDDIAPLPFGYVMKDAFGINDLGQVVGTAAGLAGDRGYLCDLNTNKSLLLPSGSGPPGVMSARSINNFGDIVSNLTPDSNTADRWIVLYPWNGTAYPPPIVWEDGRAPTAISDARQIMSGGGRRYTLKQPSTWPVSSVDDFNMTNFSLSYPGMYASATNEFGTFVGDHPVYKSGGNPKSRSLRSAFRFTDPDQMLELREATNLSGYSVNHANDVCVTVAGGRPFVYTDEYKLLPLDDLIIGTPADVTRWLTSGPRVIDINDRDSTEFGQIGGDAGFHAFPLTPELPTP